MSRTKKQHYLPRAAYLQHFATLLENKPVLWVYQVGQSGIDLDKEKAIPPDNLCKETYMYEAPSIKVNAVEQFLEGVERAYGELLRESVLTKQPLSPQEKQILSMFVSTLEARLPGPRDRWLKFLSQIEEKVVALEDRFRYEGESETLQGIRDAKEWIFPYYVAAAAEVNRWQFSSFLILHNEAHKEPAPGRFFITSDSPVTHYDFTMMNSLLPAPPLSSTIEVLVPLTPHVLLFINNRGLEGHETIDPNFIDEANNRVLWFARGRVFSPHKLDRRQTDPIIQRHRQSFLLKYRTPSSTSGQQT